jgi:hypothetical protein
LRPDEEVWFYMSTTAAERLKKEGFCRFDLGEANSRAEFDGILPRLQKAVEHLPQDPYANSPTRYRRYSAAIVLPWCRRLEWLPNFGTPEEPYTEYYQTERFNPEFPQVYRKFEPLTDELKTDPALERLVWHDFDLTFWTERQLARPFVAGFHLVKLTVNGAGGRAPSSPDHLHQDGEPFTFVHLVTRENAVGARNVIAVPDCNGSQPEKVAKSDILAEFELLTPLESYGVYDQAVSHYVSALTRGSAAGPAVRAAVLIDFTPLVPIET